MNRLLLITDAWMPQINGVATTYKSIVPMLEGHGIEAKIIHPDLFRTVPTTYPDVRFALVRKRTIHSIIKSFKPTTIHIGVEGPLGIQAKRLCDKLNFKYTTSFHTKYAEYMKEHFGIPTVFGWKCLKWFHSKSSNILVPTDSLITELSERGFRNLSKWTRGVDTDLFHPRSKTMEGTILTYVGRVSKEKNIRAFLDVNVDGTKVVVGDGPELTALKKEYPNVVFLGMLTGEPLAQAYANSDVFVFPSKTDTFGIVILEALASGVPVASYNVTGPKDILTEPGIGFMHADLEIAITNALKQGDKKACVTFAQHQSWKKVGTDFVKSLIPIN